MYVKDLWIRFYASSLFLYTFESAALQALCCKAFLSPNRPIKSYGVDKTISNCVPKQF